MKRHTAEQLPLPMSLVDSITLREELDRMQGACEGWKAYAHQSEHSLEILRRERNAAQADLAQVTMERDIWRTQAQTSQFLLSLAQSGARLPDPAPTAWLGSELRKLLTLAHPDKWSQDQPATLLAHEVTVVLNALRQRLGER